MKPYRCKKCGCTEYYPVKQLKNGKVYTNRNCRNCNKANARRQARESKGKWLKWMKQHVALECHVCGYKRHWAPLQFHHLDPTEKEFQISPWLIQKPTDKRKATVLAEIKRCVLLCANCHFEVHAGVTKLNDEISI